MESASSVACSSTRNQQPRKKQKVNEGEDFISKLPESLISRILSFLRTEEAVRTSVLSKRWIYLWTTINKLEFNDFMFRRGLVSVGDMQRFVNFMNKTLLLTKGASMESISLFINGPHDVSIINTWLSSIFNRSVKLLEISSILEIPFSFSPLASHSLFNSSESLEELLLEMDGCDIKIPTTYVLFGYLKSLHFSGIKFTVDSSCDHLTLSLPVLKKFEMTNCTWINAKGITVEAPQLEIIEIEQDYTSASGEPPGSAITFSPLQLKKFSYHGYYDISRTVILSDPSSAHNASARVVLTRCGLRGRGSLAFHLFKQFSQMMRIDFYGSEFLTQPEVAILPVFAMLIHLELGLVTGEVLLDLLHKCPVLRILVLKGISKFDKDIFNSAAVPDCLASTLRVVRFERVTDDEHEPYMLLGKYFRENGLGLMYMGISLYRW